MYLFQFVKPTWFSPTKNYVLLSGSPLRGYHLKISLWDGYAIKISLLRLPCLTSFNSASRAFIITIFLPTWTAHQLYSHGVVRFRSVDQSRNWGQSNTCFESMATTHSFILGMGFSHIWATTDYMISRSLPFLIQKAWELHSDSGNQVSSHMVFSHKHGTAWFHLSSVLESSLQEKIISANSSLIYWYWTFVFFMLPRFKFILDR